MVTDARKKATVKYAKTHLKRIPLDVQLTEYDIIKSEADKRNEPVNTFVKKAIWQRIETEKGLL